MFTTPSFVVTSYMVKHTQVINVIDFCSTDEEVASYEDEDRDSEAGST